MALLLLGWYVLQAGIDSPKQEKQDAKKYGKNADTDGIGLLEDLYDAVQKCSDPQEPLEECSQHEGANNGDIDNLG